MNYKKLREKVCWANLQLVEDNLVILTWGNVSGINREDGIVAIKPSGVEYTSLTPKDIVLLSLKTGKVIEGELQPSSDAPTHLELYRAFSSIGGIVHTHSPYATAWAQSDQNLPCYGTTHADHFYGDIPITRMLSDDEIDSTYEENTGKVIVEHFQNRNINPQQMPAVLSPYHGPFTWGDSPETAEKNALVLEEVAKMAALTQHICPESLHIPHKLLDKHFLRKHGPEAYYGQNTKIKETQNEY